VRLRAVAEQRGRQRGVAAPQVQAARVQAERLAQVELLPQLQAALERVVALVLRGSTPGLERTLLLLLVTRSACH